MKRFIFALFLTAAPLLAENTPVQNKGVFDYELKRLDALKQDKFKYKVGTFTSSAGAGNQSVTGIGFRPRSILLGFVSGSGSTVLGALGATDCTNSVAIGGWGENDNSGGAPDVGGLGPSVSYLIHWPDTSGSVVGRATLVSCDSDGFTVNWANADAKTIVYFAFQ